MPETTYLSLNNSSIDHKRRNLYIGSAIIGFLWISFHFTAMYFFTWILESPFFVGLYMALGNVVALIVDIPIGMLQRYFSPKKLLVAAAILQLGASLIFTKFIFLSTTINASSNDFVSQVLSLFLDDIGNLLLLLLASIFYGLAKELNDITIMSYILDNSNPSEYPQILSRNNLITGGGMLIGLVASGIFLSLGHVMAVIVLNIFIFLLILFIHTYFDNTNTSISIADIQKLRCVVERNGVSNAGKYLIAEISKTDVAAIANKVKVLFFRPMKRETQSQLSIATLVAGTKTEIRSVIQVIQPLPLLLVWFILVSTGFGFWDTFAGSFLIDHIKSFENSILTFLILGSLAIPAFGMQGPFLSLSKKIGEQPVLFFGVACSGVSLLCMGLFSGGSLGIFYICALINSLGFAAAVPLAQSGFIEAYTLAYSRLTNSSEVDSNVAAGPTKMVQNLANVLGLLFGGLLLSLLQYEGFFIFFGSALLGLLGYGLSRWGKLKTKE